MDFTWSNGHESRTASCGRKAQPMQLSAAGGVDATLTAAVDASITLDEALGITGSLTTALHAGYHPGAHPLAQLDAHADYDLGACLACVWKGSPARASLVSGRIFEATLLSYDTPPPAATLGVTTTSLPAASQYESYSAALAATGGTGPYTWTLVGGTLPTGLSLTSARSLTGTPATAGSYPVTVRVTDQEGVTATSALSLDVTAAPVVSVSPTWNHPPGANRAFIRPAVANNLVYTVTTATKGWPARCRPTRRTQGSCAGSSSCRSAVTRSRRPATTSWCRG